MLDGNSTQIAEMVGNVFLAERIQFIQDLFQQLKGPLKRIFIVYIIFIGIGAFFSVQIIDLFKSILPEGIMLVAFSPIDVFFSVIWLIIAFAFVFTFPIILFELIKFISPALYANERNVLTRMVPVSLILFTSGAVFGVGMMAFFGLAFFAGFGLTYGVQNLWSLSGLIHTMVFIAIGFGAAFQLPVVMIILNKQNVITIEQFKSVRRYIIVGLLIAAAVLTPPDVISQIMMAVPLYIMYEGTLLYLKWSKHNVYKA